METNKTTTIGLGNDLGAPSQAVVPKSETTVIQKDEDKEEEGKEGEANTIDILSPVAYGAPVRQHEQSELGVSFSAMHPAEEMASRWGPITPESVKVALDCLLEERQRTMGAHLMHMQTQQAHQYSNRTLAHAISSMGTYKQSEEQHEKNIALKKKE